MVIAIRALVGASDFLYPAAGWYSAALLLLALSSAACGSDSSGTAPGVGGAGGAAGEPGLDAGGEPHTGEGGADSPVTPGELVCKSDDDCQPAPSISLGSDHYYRYLVSFTTAVAP